VYPISIITTEIQKSDTQKQIRKKRNETSPRTNQPDSSNQPRLDELARTCSCVNCWEET